MRHWAACACLILSLWSPLLAQSREEQSAVLTESARKLYRAGQYEEALRLFEKAYSLSPGPVLLYNVGRTADKAGDRVKARAALEQFLREVTDADGRVRGEKALAEVMARWPAYLRVTSPTAGALVEVDGQPRGKVPLPALEVPAGHHAVKVVAPGKRVFERALDLKPDESVEVVAVLEDQPAVVKLRFTPTEARLRLDGQPLERAKTEALSLKPGRHSLHVEADGYASHDEDLFLAAAEQRTVQVTLERLPPPTVVEAPKPVRQPEPAPVSVVTERASSNSRQTLAWVFTGLGAAALGAGGYLLWRMGDLHGQADDLYAGCQKDPTASTRGSIEGKVGDARTSGIAGYATLGAGAVVAGLAVYCFATAPADGDVTLWPTVTPDGAGLTLRAGW